MRRTRGWTFSVVAGSLAAGAVASCGGDIDRSTSSDGGIAATDDAASSSPSEGGGASIGPGCVSVLARRQCRVNCLGGLCRDVCWSECPDASTDDAPPDAGALCSRCTFNDDCQAGALCVQLGALDGGPAFCSRACRTNVDCPLGFSCVDQKQCVPRTIVSCE